MTLNKYQKYNENIRLDDDAKEAILKSVMETEIKPAKRRIPGWRFAAVFACGLAAVVFLIIPRHPQTYNEMAMSTADEAPAEGAMDFSAEAAEEPAMAAGVSGADSLSYELGYRVPDLSGYGNGYADYERVSETGGKIVLFRDDNVITILTDPALEKAETTEEETAVNSYMEDAKASELVSELVFEAGGVQYQITFEPAVDADAASALEQYIREDVQR